ncbi:ABC transporter-like protein 12 [Sarcoptes scabiei]|uniref:ABC transporter-like protein 12 n=1 Tax=Sarcoptes scabiei TaxID=52283 RepID=A0A132A9P4_SARSC|nr:ABC transporter-like protein 12 [Sarcoptes scabiei]
MDTSKIDQEYRINLLGKKTFDSDSIPRIMNFNDVPSIPSCQRSYEDQIIIDDHSLTDQQDSSTRLVWRNLSYTVEERSLRLSQSKKKTIIKNLNGCIQAGQLTAIIGPSGAGKTTLIECLAGRRIGGVQGDISIKYRGISKSSIKISYYSQHDSLDELLTVEESLRYAIELFFCQRFEKIANSSNCCFMSSTNMSSEKFDQISTKDRKQMMMQRLVNELHLQKCYKVLVGKCSGGQKRRLSIALELIFSPKILLLDEPTSGLDSLSSLQCIVMLKKLVMNEKAPMMIATSIHQPTAKIMSYFDNLYIISYNGYCIYNGPTGCLVQTLSAFNLNCPQYHNPADFVMEVATGDFGQEPINRLEDYFEHICLEQTKYLDNDSEKTLPIKKLVKSTQKHCLLGQILAVWILIRRCLLISFRDSNIYVARSVAIFSSLFIIFILYRNYKVGELDGCAQKPTKDILNNLENFELFTFENIYYGNFGFIFYSIILMVFMAILPTLLSFPLDVSVFIKENFNGWYSLKSYYVARNISDLPPILFFPILYGTISYFLTYQLFEWHRFFLFISILICVASLGQGLGFVVSAYFVKDVTSSTVVGGVINIPLLLFTGLLVKISVMPEYFRPVTYLSYFRLAFEALLVSIYGLDRCDSIEPITYSDLKEQLGEEVIDMYVCMAEISPTATENITNLIDRYNEKFLTKIQNSSSSMALQSFQYNDETLWYSLFAMAIYMTILRLAAYSILYRKTTVK